MVTSYNLKDMVSFGKFSALWQKKGMLEMDPDGNPIISKEHVENWKVGKEAYKWDLDTQTIQTAQLLTALELFETPTGTLVVKKGTQANLTDLIDTSLAKGVVTAYIAGGSIHVPTKYRAAREFLSIASLYGEDRLNSGDPEDSFGNHLYIQASFPTASFPVYNINGDLISFGVCFHTKHIQK